MPDNSSPAVAASGQPVGAGSGQSPRYVLDEQVGFLLRQVNQRHTTIFAEWIGEDLTPRQWAVLSKLREVGATSQNLLGRLVTMDAATVKGVVDRLRRRGLLDSVPDPTDGRRVFIDLTRGGEVLVDRTIEAATRVTEKTLAPLNDDERATLMRLLERLR
jgi:DNA-binding MarR family transcriptional regulator